MDRGGSLPKLVISYRRRDSEAMTGRIFDRLVAHYGREAVFRDIDNIPPGIDFRAHIADALAHSDILLAIIGPRWAGRSGRAGLARIDDENDLVRIEVETALQRGIPVIPVLLGDTKMPSADRVPDSLQDFVFRQAIRVDPGRDFEHHVDGLTTEIDRLLGSKLPVAAAEPVGGEQNVKNIAWPVRVNALRAESIAEIPAPGVPPTSPISQPTVAPRLSIVVLPFANLGNDPEQEYFADGITYDLTTDLSRISGSFVIARTTAFAYRGKPVDVQQIGRELSVRYVLEGSVRRTGDQVRVNVQLIDAESGAHIWADRFDTDRANLVDAQREITGRLARSLDLELVRDVGRRIELETVSDPDARDLVMRGWAYYHRPRSPTALQEARHAFEQALEIDPRSVDARIGIARALLVNLVGNFLPRSNSSFQKDSAHTEELLLEAIESDTSNTMARSSMGQLRRLQNRLTEARIEFETAISLGANDEFTHGQLAWTLLLLGQPDAAFVQAERTLRLSPRDPSIWGTYLILGWCQLLLDEAEPAMELLIKSRAASPRPWVTHFGLAAALGLVGDLEGAKAVLADSLKLNPEVNSLAQFRAYRPWGNSQYWTLFEKTAAAGLRTAGLPEE
jgi:TolB-like protein/Tfp pilus assembly protein PilF